MQIQSLVGKASKVQMISTGTVGAFRELMVATDLMRKGFHVFRALSPACPVDLAIMHEGRFMPVEVKTGHEFGINQITWPDRSRSFPVIWAVCLQDDRIFYFNNALEKIDLQVVDERSWKPPKRIGTCRQCRAPIFKRGITYAGLCSDKCRCDEINGKRKRPPKI